MTEMELVALFLPLVAIAVNLGATVVNAMQVNDSRHLVPVQRRLSDEERLLRELFTDYKASARPVLNSTCTVHVNITFSLMHIKDLDVRSQVLTTTGLLILEWEDERLRWNPRYHNNLEEIIIEAKSLWRPEFAVINGAEKIYEDYNQVRAVISHEGKVHWEPCGVFRTMCEIDITYYPFDTQNCSLTFGAWSYHTSKMNLTNATDLINKDSYKENGEWEIFTTHVKRNEFFYNDAPDQKFANVEFTLRLRRRHTFYIMNVILPSIMTSVLLLSIFFCTPGQKVQIGVVVLLSFRIFLLNVAGNIPKTSDHIPLLGIYLTATMAITTLSMVLTVFVLNLHHITDRPVPSWVRTVMLTYVARMLGMCSAPVEGSQVKDTDDKEVKYVGLADTGCRYSPIFRRVTDTPCVVPHDRTTFVELQNRNWSRKIMTVDSICDEKQQEQMEEEIKEKETEKEDYSKDWRKLAEVFDRLFFWLFLIAIFVSTMVLFHPLTERYWASYEQR